MKDLKEMIVGAFLSDLLVMVVGVTYMLGWLAGIALANGFWSTLFAIITGGLYSWYLIVERVLIQYQWIM